MLFERGARNTTTETVTWCVSFFFASAGASAAYLTVSEIFPMETRALAISFFDAVGTAIGGITGPLLFGRLVESGENAVMYGYFLGAEVMIIGGIVEWVLGVEAGARPRVDRQAAHHRKAELRDADRAGEDDLDLDRLQGERT